MQRMLLNGTAKSHRLIQTTGLVSCLMSFEKFLVFKHKSLKRNYPRISVSSWLLCSVKRIVYLKEEYFKHSVRSLQASIHALQSGTF